MFYFLFFNLVIFLDNLTLLLFYIQQYKQGTLKRLITLHDPQHLGYVWYTE